MEHDRPSAIFPEKCLQGTIRTIETVFISTKWPPVPFSESRFIDIEEYSAFLQIFLQDIFPKTFI